MAEILEGGLNFKKLGEEVGTWTPRTAKRVSHIAEKKGICLLCDQPVNNCFVSEADEDGISFAGRC